MKIPIFPFAKGLGALRAFALAALSAIALAGLATPAQAQLDDVLPEDITEALQPVLDILDGAGLIDGLPLDDLGATVGELTATLEEITGGLGGGALPGDLSPEQLTALIEDLLPALDDAFGTVDDLLEGLDPGNTDILAPVNELTDSVLELVLGGLGGEELPLPLEELDLLGLLDGVAPEDLLGDVLGDDLTDVTGLLDTVESLTDTVSGLLAPEAITDALQPVLDILDGAGLVDELPLPGDLAGITELLETLDPAALTDLLDELLPALDDAFATVSDLLGGLDPGETGDLLALVTDLTDTVTELVLGDVLGGDLPVGDLTDLLGFLDGLDPADLEGLLGGVLDGLDPIDLANLTDTLGSLTDTLSEILLPGAITEVLQPVLDILEGAGVPLPDELPLPGDLAGITDILDEILAGDLLDNLDPAELTSLLEGLLPALDDALATVSDLLGGLDPGEAGGILELVNGLVTDLIGSTLELVLGDILGEDVPVGNLPDLLGLLDGLDPEGLLGLLDGLDPTDLASLTDTLQSVLDSATETLLPGAITDALQPVLDILEGAGLPLPDDLPLPGDLAGITDLIDELVGGGLLEGLTPEELAELLPALDDALATVSDLLGGLDPGEVDGLLALVTDLVDSVLELVLGGILGEDLPFGDLPELLGLLDELDLEGLLGDALGGDLTDLAGLTDTLESLLGTVGDTLLPGAIEDALQPLLDELDLLGLLDPGELPLPGDLAGLTDLLDEILGGDLLEILDPDFDGDLPGGLDPEEIVGQLEGIFDALNDSLGLLSGLLEGVDPGDLGVIEPVNELLDSVVTLLLEGIGGEDLPLPVDELPLEDILGLLDDLGDAGLLDTVDSLISGLLGILDQLLGGLLGGGDEDTTGLTTILNTTIEGVLDILNIDALNGEDGAPGEDGTDGQDGEDGTDGQDGEDGTDGQDGEDGTDGQDGQDGEDGADGQDGQDGRDFTGSGGSATGQIDLIAGKRGGVGKGNNVYGNYAGQRYTDRHAVKKRFKAPSNFTFTVENDDRRTDRPTLKGSRSKSFLKVQYFVSGKNRTGAIRTGRYNEKSLTPGALYVVKVKTTARPKLRKANGELRQKNAVIRMSAQSQHGPFDRAMIRLKTGGK